jgi:uncharacterized membrane protein YqjE
MTHDDTAMDPKAYEAPSPLGSAIEATIALEMIRRAIVVGPVIVAGAWVLRDGLAAVSAAIGVAVVAANFWLSGVILSRAAARSLRAYHAAALLGFFVRLGLITLSMFSVAAVFEVDRPALGIAAVVAYLTLLTWEAWALTRSPGREYEWTS